MRNRRKKQLRRRVRRKSMGRRIEGIKKGEEEKNREYRELRRRFGR